MSLSPKQWGLGLKVSTTMPGYETCTLMCILLTCLSPTVILFPPRRKRGWGWGPIQVLKQSQAQYGPLKPLPGVGLGSASSHSRDLPMTASPGKKARSALVPEVNLAGSGMEKIWGGGGGGS